MLKAAIFDMDGVIVNTEPLHHKAYQRMFNDVNIQVSDKLYTSFTGQSTLEICKELCNRFELRIGAETLMELKRDHFRLIFETDDSLGLIDGVLDLIKDFHSNGLILILGSSASMENINTIFTRFDLDQYFKAKFSGADLKASKPHPEIFEKAADATGFERHKCLVIEDSTNGVKAAKAAGIFCVGYDSFHSKDQDYSLADVVISDFRDVSYAKIQELFISTAV